MENKDNVVTSKKTSQIKKDQKLLERLSSACDFSPRNVFGKHLAKSTTVVKRLQSGLSICL